MNLLLSIVEALGAPFTPFTFGTRWSQLAIPRPSQATALLRSAHCSCAYCGTDYFPAATGAVRCPSCGAPGVLPIDPSPSITVEVCASGGAGPFGL